MKTFINILVFVGSLVVLAMTLYYLWLFAILFFFIY